MTKRTVPAVFPLTKSVQGVLSGRRFPVVPEVPQAEGGGMALMVPGTKVPAGTGQLSNSNRVYDVLLSSFEKKLADPNMIRIGDGNYYLPTRKEVEAILKASRLDRKTWMEERFDCDDFSYVLKGEFSAHWYKAGMMRYGLCCGIVWGNFKWVQGYHAINWFIDSQLILWLIEPQSDKIYAVDECEGNVQLLLV